MAARDTIGKVRLQFNPIMVKEFRSRMRGWRAFGTLTFYLIFLALFSYGVYRVTISAAGFAPTPLSPLIGRALYVSLTGLSLFFVAFLTPSLTAGAISTEQEKLTLEMLQATPLNPHAIILGKLVATASYILLLLLAAIPLVSLVFTFGGVAPADLWQAALVILVTAFTFGMVGLFFSAWRRRTTQAIALSYLVVLLLIIGSIAIFIFWGIITRDFPPRYILIANPFSALFSVFATTTSNGGSSGIFELFNVLAGVEPGVLNRPEGLQPLWYYTTLIYLGLSAVLYFLTTRLIKPIRPWRISWRSLSWLLLVLGIFAVVGGLVTYRDVRTTQEWLQNPTPTPVRPGPVMIEQRAVPIAPPLPTPTVEGKTEE